jgi:hypothetical protein
MCGGALSHCGLCCRKRLLWLGDAAVSQSERRCNDDVEKLREHATAQRQDIDARVEQKKKKKKKKQEKKLTAATTHLDKLLANALHRVGTRGLGQRAHALATRQQRQANHQQQNRCAAVLQHGGRHAREVRQRKTEEKERH